MSSEASGTGGWQDCSDHGRQVNAACSQRAGTGQHAREQTCATIVTCVRLSNVEVVPTSSLCGERCAHRLLQCPFCALRDFAPPGLLDARLAPPFAEGAPHGCYCTTTRRGQRRCTTISCTPATIHSAQLSKSGGCGCRPCSRESSPAHPARPVGTYNSGAQSFNTMHNTVPPTSVTPL